MNEIERETDKESSNEFYLIMHVTKINCLWLYCSLDICGPRRIHTYNIFAATHTLDVFTKLGKYVDVRSPKRKNEKKDQRFMHNQIPFGCFPFFIPTTKTVQKLCYAFQRIEQRVTTEKKTL